jgi:hypothetical protein
VAALLLGHPANADDVAASTCSQAHVQAAIDAATNGDRVVIPAGNCAWSTTVRIPGTKGITLQGAGTSQTIIRDLLTDGHALDVDITPPIFTRISGITFDSEGIDKLSGYATIHIEGSGRTAEPNFRVDHNLFDEVRRRGVMVVARPGPVLHGLIDNNIFNCPYDGNCQAVSIFGGPTRDSGMFAVPVEFGTGNFVYVESNVFNYAYQNDSLAEGYFGARYVMRFNTIHTGTIGNHGADSGNARGTMAYEIYNNDIDLSTCLGNCQMRAMHLRSGTGFIFNNAWESSGFSPGFTAITPDNYRSRDVYTTDWLGESCAHGTNTRDGNDFLPRGRHCLDQIGTLFTETMDGSHSHVPLYFFNITLNAARMGILVQTGGPQLDIRPNEDYYEQIDAFIGIAGVGVGPRATRPATCTPGVAYWATDEGEWNGGQVGPDGRLYTCTSLNTWTLHYTPYVYPHPLTQADTEAPTVTIDLP